MPSQVLGLNHNENIRNEDLCQEITWGEEKIACQRLDLTSHRHPAVLESNVIMWKTTIMGKEMVHPIVTMITILIRDAEATSTGES